MTAVLYMRWLSSVPSGLPGDGHQTGRKVLDAEAIDLISGPALIKTVEKNSLFFHG